MESRNFLGVPSAEVNSTTGYATGLSFALFLRDAPLWSFCHSRATTVPGARSAPARNETDTPARIRPTTKNSAPNAMTPNAIHRREPCPRV
jgi:hypothetical protein